jgi:hypothetical protein
MKSPLFKHEQYKRILSSVEDFKKQFDQLKSENKYSHSYLSNLKNEFEQAWKNDLQEFYVARSKEIESNMMEIEAEYKKDPYEDMDVQKELLKRQDWERKLKISSNDDLKEQVESFKKSGEGEPVQLEMLQIELMNRGLDHEVTHLKAYKDHYDIDRPYVKDERYGPLEEESVLIQQLKNTGLLYVEKEDGDFEPVSINLN